MKKLNLVLLALSTAVIGTAIAQAEKTSNLNETAKFVCNQTDRSKACAKDAFETRRLSPPPLPPRPPAPPAPPTPPAPPNSPPPMLDAPPAPDLAELVAHAELTALPELPSPPPPPTPPKFEAPPQAQAACQGVSDGTKVKWSPGVGEYYAGVCVKKNDDMYFDVHEHRIDRRKKK